MTFPQVLRAVNFSNKNSSNTLNCQYGLVGGLSVSSISDSIVVVCHCVHVLFVVVLQGALPFLAV